MAAGMYLIPAVANSDDLHSVNQINHHSQYNVYSSQNEQINQVEKHLATLRSWHSLASKTRCSSDCYPCSTRSTTEYPTRAGLTRKRDYLILCNASFPSACRLRSVIFSCRIRGRPHQPCRVFDDFLRSLVVTVYINDSGHFLCSVAKGCCNGYGAKNIFNLRHRICNFFDELHEIHQKSLIAEFEIQKSNRTSSWALNG